MNDGQPPQDCGERNLKIEAPHTSSIPLNERVEMLEIHVTHLERQVEILNEVVIDQGKTLKRLLAVQQQLASTMEAQETDRIRLDVSRPPHSR